MNIKSKLFILAPLSVFGILVISGAFTLKSSIEEGYQEKIAASQHIQSLVDSLEISFLRARRHEKDFLLRQDEKYAKRHAKVTAETNEQIDKLAELVENEYPGKLSDPIEGLRTEYATYKTAFLKLAEEKQKLGFSEKLGLQGKLRQSVHTAEEAVKIAGEPELMVKILMMRRHEKDFMMRINTKYLDRLNKRVEEFGKLPPQKFGSLTAKKEIIEQIDGYQRSFSAFVDSTLRERALRKVLSKSFAEVEPVLKNISAFANSRKAELNSSIQSSNRKLFWAILGSLLLIAAVIGFVIHLIGNSISRPISSIVRGLKAFSNGDIDVQVEGENRSDEIGDIARSFLEFKTAAAEKVELEKTASEDRKLREQERLDRERQKTLDAEKLSSAVAALGSSLQRLANGELDCQIDDTFTDEIEKLRRDFNSSVATLSNSLSKVDTSGTSIEKDVRELTSAAGELSMRTEAQAKSLEETSSALEEITATLQSSAEGAKEAAELVSATKESTSSSGKVVSDAVLAMERIENASNEISKIISVIDEIAFQTNLLALNAGVEAARAGDAGSGFAVVATEVRELAQRSTTAAKEIKELITESVNEVEAGVELVQSAGTALSEIAVQVQTVDERIRSLAEAAAEQSTGIKEINSAVQKMDQVTQQNAAMAEETSAATHNLSASSHELSKVIAKFRTSHVETMADDEKTDFEKLPLAG